MDRLEGKQFPISDAVYALQLDGRGGVIPLQQQSAISQDSPVWLHLDYTRPVSAEWLQITPLLPDSVRELLAGESQRPRVTRTSEGALLTLRNINFAEASRPDQLITICVYITEKLIISTQQQQVYGFEHILADIKHHTGPTTTGDWLVQIADAITDHMSDFVDELHDRIIDLEDNILDQQIPERGEMALLRKQLIIMRRYMSPQRDVFARLANDRFSWMCDDDRHRIRDIAERLGRGLDDLDAGVARTTILTDEISTLMAESLNRRSYTMSLLAMLFLPLTFFTGLLGVNLGGIPGNQSPYGFIIFSVLLVLMVAGVTWWLKRSKWL